MQAAGLVVFRNVENSVEYLLLQASYGKHHWTPPKGFVGARESAWQAAIRETQEETGLQPSSYEVLQNSQYIDSYFDPSKNSQKAVHYWLAHLKDSSAPIVLSREHRDFRWLGFHDACEITGWDNFRKLLQWSEEFIRNAANKIQV